ncbi:chromosomal replication initiator protein DnaA [Spirochaetota bacterium]|nr:chromosomal replication initiator protein DnaA [Spirochaetota bacterium]
MQEATYDLFTEAMRTVKARLPKTDYSLWLEDLRFSAYEKGHLTLITEFRIKKNRIIARYNDFLAKTFAEHFSDFKKLSICYQGENTMADMATSHPLATATTTASLGKNTSGTLKTPSEHIIDTPSSTTPSSKTTQLKHSSKYPSKPEFAPNKKSPYILPDVLKENIFDNFLVVEENELAHRFARKSIDQFSRHSPLYLYGPVGTGKTHLLQAVANEVRNRFPFYKIKYVTPDKFIQAFTSSIFSKTDRDFRLRYQSVDLLIIDDIQFFGGKEKSSIEFFHIFNNIYVPGKQMLFASDAPPSELAAFDLRLKSRLSASIIVSIPAIEIASRERFLTRFAHQHKLVLTEPVIQFLAKHLPGNIRELKGAITTLKETLAIYQEQKPTLTADKAFCTRILSDRFIIPEQSVSTSTKIYTPEAILKEVCQASAVTMKELRSTKKTKHLAKIRQCAAYLLKKHTHLSITEIGHYLGGKTPSAISYSLSSVERNITTDKIIKLFFTKIEKQMAIS